MRMDRRVGKNSKCAPAVWVGLCVESRYYYAYHIFYFYIIWLRISYVWIWYTISAMIIKLSTPRWRCLCGFDEFRIVNTDCCDFLIRMLILFGGVLIWYRLEYSLLSSQDVLWMFSNHPGASRLKIPMVSLSCTVYCTTVSRNYENLSVGQGRHPFPSNSTIHGFCFCRFPKELSAVIPFIFISPATWHRRLGSFTATTLPASNI